MNHNIRSWSLQKWLIKMKSESNLEGIRVLLKLKTLNLKITQNYKKAK